MNKAVEIDRKTHYTAITFSDPASNSLPATTLASLAAAIDPGKGPVILNYGLEECRFIKPVYAGMTLHVRLTVKEKVEQEKKTDDDIPKGIVKFYVDIRDQEEDSVAIATILTMVMKKEI